jgi:hypothetical protein
MIWTLTWSWVAEHRDILALDRATAERMDAALLRLAETGRGPLEQADSNLYRLHVKGAVAFLFFDRAARSVLVKRIYRRAT